MEKNKYNITSFTTKFLNFETKEIFESDWEIWQAIRYFVYVQIRDQIFDISSATSEKNIGGNSKIIALKNIFAFILRSFMNRKKNIFFAASRYQNAKGLHFDPNILDVYNHIKEDSFIIESVFSRDGYVYKSCNNGIAGIKKLFQIIIKKNVELPPYINKRIFDIFGIKLNLIPLNEIIRNYLFEKKFYFLYFKFMQPKRIFLTQNGIQIAMFNAANKLKIPLTEFQHGIIFYGHPSYTYPENINKNLISLPNYFLSFSDFWKNKVKDYFPTKIVVLGNNYASKIDKKEPKYDITFISSTYHNRRFITIIKDLYALGFSGSVCIKLHPAQSSEFDNTKKEMEKFKNVRIVYNEHTMKEVIAMSKIMIAIESTSIYEALDAHKHVIIIKEMSYENMSDVFDNPLVDLASSAEEIIDKISRMDKLTFKESNNRYFEPFKESVCNAFLSSSIQYV